ncbi:MAG: hypothetical protein DRQ56_10395, partial [Gammaproteobacteria bacterium]
MRNALLKIGLMAGSLSLVFMIFEIGLRFAGWSPIYEVYSKPSIMWQHDDLLGWSHVPGSRDIYIGPRPWPIEFETSIEINSLGLRGPEVKPLPPSGVRILVAGDSRAVALEVPYKQTFGALLEKNLKSELNVPVQVINVGVRGYGTDQSYLHFRDRGRKLAPDLVIFLHSQNDVRNNVTLHRMRRPFGKSVFVLDEAGEPELTGFPVPSFPLCSSISLTTSYQVFRRDSLTQRIFCNLQLVLFDRSATFTMVTMRIQQNPQLIARLYRVGAPDETASARNTDIETLPWDRRLTEALLTRFARTVRKSGSDMVLLGRNNTLGDIAAEAVSIEGARLIPLDDAFNGLDPAEVRFVNDGH